MLLIILPVKIEIWGVYPVYPIFIYSKKNENDLETCFQDVIYTLWLFNIAMEHGTLFIDDQNISNLWFTYYFYYFNGDFPVCKVLVITKLGKWYLLHISDFHRFPTSTTLDDPRPGGVFWGEIQPADSTSQATLTRGNDSSLSLVNITTVSYLWLMLNVTIVFMGFINQIVCIYRADSCN